MVSYKELGLVNTKEMFKGAIKGGYAIPAFNFNNMEQMQAIIQACAETKSPVILQVSSGARKYANQTLLRYMAQGAVEYAKELGWENPQICLHLDHGNSFELCKSCVDMGFSSVMIDGSALPYEENIALTKKVVEYAHKYDVTVEGELGVLAGVEDEVSAEASHYTQPSEVIDFTKRTGVDSLAISIGTSHGANKFTPEQCTRDANGILVPPPLRFDILKEIEKVMGCPPKRIFVEMARFNGVKGERKDSRKKKLSDLYNALGKEGAKWKEEIEKLDEGRFNQKKLYLYYMQKGRCMYTNTIIPIEDLFKDNLYDIDHVYPRHFVKDDSIENNLVLVRKQDNAHKSDSYPIESGIQGKCGGFWKELMNGGFISREKYFRLTRTEEFSEQELAGFISRQIVETGQGTKAVASILREALPDTKIVYVKASNVSAFRQDRDLLKVRSVNDFHHANDAYLNIVVGNVYFTKFTDSPLNFVRDFRRNPEKYKYHQYKMFDYDVKRRGEVAWVAQKKDGNCGTIATVKKVMARNTPLVTMMSYEGRGQLMDQTIYRAEKARTGSGYIPLKKEGPLSDVVKYGGYTNAPTAYFSLVEYTHKKKRVRAIVAVPVLWAESIQSKTELVRYLEEQCGLVKPTVKIAKINIKSTVRIDGFEYYLTGRTESRLVIVNAVQLCLSQAYMAYIKKIEKFCASDATEPADEYITKDANLELYDVLTEKHPLLMQRVSYDFSPSKAKLVSDNIKYITFRDSYGTSDSNYYLQQRWNQFDIDEAPQVGKLLDEAFNLAEQSARHDSALTLQELQSLTSEREQLREHLYTMFHLNSILVC